ncbi:helix-turn-helix domain-containing protein [Pectobacterium actinidiae]|uniref:Helix-turn-helix domain-containing protein n=1 Tax=Pectobacterium actinidiae TaxID=1507808 RepID=A0ABW8GBJ5_9GAMM|nr:helix-turn-helix transcriptional regulator [Pectobacterium actinidiae]MDY4313953.1 helix-turn-helix transcriptional regulator [Pectobacterium actinidiae]QDX96229.1 XRE family transcriptional regulator [Pectobacterium carotovorum subsp. carotovorum]
MSIFTKRLKEARKEAGVSQEWLGILAGIDEMSASARMNQYERGKHEPEFSMVERIAYVLRVPESYFFEKDDDIAWLIKSLYRADESRRKAVMEYARSMLS